MLLGESLEDYLECLLQLEKQGKIRSVDVAKMMNVSKPSVNKAMNILKDKNLIHQESYGEIHLTDEGRKFAQQIFYRHQTLRVFLKDVLGVNPEIAEEDACKIEHIISEETFQKIIHFCDTNKKKA